MDKYREFGEIVREHYYNELNSNRTISDISKEEMSPENIISYLTDYGTKIDDKIIYDAIEEYYKSNFEIKDNHILIVTDTHIGGTQEDFHLIDKAIDYASKKGIKTSINCGDIIEG